MSDNKQEEMLQDRIGEYLMPFTGDYLFDELSDSFLEKAGLLDILQGVPVPIDKKQLGNISMLTICKGMAVILGCDRNFKHRDAYVECILRTYTKDFAKPLIGEGVQSADKSDFDFACVLFRGALAVDPDNADALYCYGRACKDSYEAGEGEEYIARYKAESLEAFERLTLVKPDFDMGHYFLGYAYMNLGLYLKAKLSFDEVLRLDSSEDGASIPDKEEMVKEVKEWLEKLEEPIKIEQGYNCVLSGRDDEGIEILFPYTEDERFNTWWPLWYYLGLAYRGTGDDNSAELAFLQVLQLAPSNIEAMEELVSLYRQYGNEELEEKYARKIEVVKRNAELDCAEKDLSWS